MEKNILKKNACMSKTESLCSTAEIGTTLYINRTSIKHTHTLGRKGEVSLQQLACARAVPKQEALPLAGRLFSGLFLEKKSNKVFENCLQRLPRKLSPLTRAGGAVAFAGQEPPGSWGRSQASFGMS